MAVDEIWHSLATTEISWRWDSVPGPEMMRCISVKISKQMIHGWTRKNYNLAVDLEKTSC